MLLLCYGLIVVALATIAFSFPSRQSNPFIKAQPIPAFVAVAIFICTTLVIVLLDELFSGLSFLLISLILAAAMIFLRLSFRRVLSGRLFQNELYRVAARAATGTAGFKEPSFVNFRGALSPLLVKNLLKIIRENSIFVISLTVIYILCGAMASHNNERLEDFLVMLLTATLLYAIFFSMKIQSLFAESAESRQIFFALPFKTTADYLSVPLPASVWLVLVTTAITILALFAGTGGVSDLIFLLQSFLLSLAFVTAAINYAFAAYPYEKNGKMHFLYWGLILLILIALFYGQRYVIVFVMFGLSFIGPWRKKLLLDQ